MLYEALSSARSTCWRTCWTTSPASTPTILDRRRTDGRTLLDIAVEDASNGDADAISLLLAVTELDDAWDVAEDEWNLLVQRARGEVKKAARGRLQARPSEGSPGLACLAARLDAPAAKIATPAGFRAEDDTLVPEPLSFNTRARCAVCGVGCSERRCARCRNACYCCDAHRDADAARHAASGADMMAVCSWIFVVLLSSSRLRQRAVRRFCIFWFAEGSFACHPRT